MEIARDDAIRGRGECVSQLKASQQNEVDLRAANDTLKIDVLLWVRAIIGVLLAWKRPVWTFLVMLLMTISGIMLCLPRSMWLRVGLQLLMEYEGGECPVVLCNGLSFPCLDVVSLNFMFILND